MTTKKMLSGKLHRAGNFPAKRHEGHPLVSLQKEINRAFDGFFSPVPFRLMPEAALMPKVNVSEADKNITVTAELPGIEEKDIDVSLARGILTIKGENKTEKEEKDKNYYYMERSSGSFYRAIPVPDGADGDKAKATLKNGILTVNIPKLPGDKKTKKQIPVKSE